MLAASASASARALALLLVMGAVGGCSVGPDRRPPGGAAQLAAAEALVDAFYSFDPARLRRAMSAAPGSLPRLLYYQGWAEGGNYEVLRRRPCRFDKAGEVRCDVTVRDDLIAALRTGFDVTDTFHVAFKGGRIVGVRNSSNDPPEFDQALGWLRRERPDLLDGPCRGFFAGGPTPGECVRAVVKGFADFAARPRS